VRSNCHYDAVVSDDRLVLLPTPNTPEFSSEAMVIELTLQADYQPFSNYLADIERTLEEARVISIMER
jgi:predicted P-loop ATPase